MPTSHFHLVSEWRVRAPLERVYGALADLRSLAEFWPSVRVTGSNATREIIGRRAQLEIRGLLPIGLRAEVEIVGAAPEREIVVTSRGDLKGHGRWLLSERAGVTRARFEWDVDLTHPRLQRLARGLRPFLIASHRWAMWRGERGLRRMLQ